jgi:hypothetical protein
MTCRRIQLDDGTSAIICGGRSEKKTMAKTEWPLTGEQVRDAGYKSKDRGECRACKKPIVWTETPHGKMIPLSKIGARWQPHFVDCPNAADFRKK